MRMVRVLVCFALLHGWAPASSSAQPPAQGDRAGRHVDPVGGVSLSDAIRLGLRAEPGLQAARTTVDGAIGERRQAALRPNPEIAVERREQASGADSQTTLMVDMPLDLFRRGPRILAADRGVDAARASVADRERLLAAAVREQFGEVLIAVRRLEIMDGLVSVNRRTFELLRDRVAAGAAPPLERDLAAVELRRLEGERELGVGRADAALAALKPLLGLGPADDLRLRGSLDEPVAAGSATSAVSIDQRADIREAEARISLAGALLLRARQERKPEIGVFGGYMRMVEGATSHNLAAGVRVTVPLFDRGQGTIAASAALQAGATRELDARRLAAGSELAVARARAGAAERAIAAYTGDARTLARKNLDVVQETYLLGRATLFDVLNEQRRYLEFENGYTDALAEAFAAETARQRATGEVR